MSGVTNVMEPMFGLSKPRPDPVYVPAPPTPPAQDAASQAQQAAAAEGAVAATEAGGKASTILTGPDGVTKKDDNETIARNTLLGSP